MHLDLETCLRKQPSKYHHAGESGSCRAVFFRSIVFSVLFPYSHYTAYGVPVNTLFYRRKLRFYFFLALFWRFKRRFLRFVDPIFRRPLPVALTPILNLLLVFIVSDQTKLLQIRLRIVYHQIKCKASPASFTKKRVYLVI